MVSDKLILVTSNLLHNQPIANPEEDANWIIANWHPDIWGCQESENYGKMLSTVSPNYGLAIHDRTLKGPDVECPILYKRDTMRHVASFARRIHAGKAPPNGYPARYVNFSHFIDRRSNQSIWYFNTHLDPHIETNGHPNNLPRVPLQTKHLHALANLVVAHGTGDHIAFWGGDFNLDEDADNKVNWGGFANSIFHKAGLQSIYDELGTPASFDTLGNRKVDVIGSYKPDGRVSGKDVHRSPNSVHSDHRFVMAEYDVVRKKGVSTPVGSTNPLEYNDPYRLPSAEPEAPAVPWKPTRTDHGPIKDHTSCCGGRAL